MPRLFEFHVDLDNSLRFFDGYRERSLDWLGLSAGESVLDVGCGVGLGLVGIARRVGTDGRVVGIDVDRRRVEVGRRRLGLFGLPIELLVDDIRASTLPDAWFDAIRVDRVLADLDRPERAAAELARLVRPGGRLLASEPDWSTLVISGPDRSITNRIIRAHVDRVPTGALGHELAALIDAAGFLDIQISYDTLLIGNPEMAAHIFMFERLADEAVEDGAITSAEGGAWIESIVRSIGPSPFLAAMTGFGVRAVRASP